MRFYQRVVEGGSEGRIPLIPFPPPPLPRAAGGEGAWRAAGRICRAGGLILLLVSLPLLITPLSASFIKPTRESRVPPPPALSSASPSVCLSVCSSLQLSIRLSICHSTVYPFSSTFICKETIIKTSINFSTLYENKNKIKITIQAQYFLLHNHTHDCPFSVYLSKTHTHIYLHSAQL